MTSWDIVTTVRERPEVLRHFVDHHLGLGCNRIHIYFDDPLDKGFSDLAGETRLNLRSSVIPRFKKDGAQVAHGRRQSENATDGLRNSDADWIIHLDADELLHPAASMVDFLDGLEPSVMQARILPCEAVFADFGSAKTAFNTEYFRRSFNNRQEASLAARVYEEALPLLRRGMSGHTIGKSILRVRHRYEAVGGIHSWKDPSTGNWLPEHEVVSGISLLHFDAISYPIWKEKLAKRVEGSVNMSGKDPHRLRQVELFAAAYREANEAALEKLFCDLYVLNNRQISLLQANKCLLQARTALSHESANSRHPGQSNDLL